MYFKINISYNGFLYKGTSNVTNSIESILGNHLMN